MRALRHLFAPSSARLFPADMLERIAAATAASEALHTGEICFAVEAALPLGLASPLPCSPPSVKSMASPAHSRLLT